MNLYALQLYRALLKASRRLPSLHRQQHVARKVSNGFSIKLEAFEPQEIITNVPCRPDMNLSSTGIAQTGSKWTSC